MTIGTWIDQRNTRRTRRLFAGAGALCLGIALTAGSCSGEPDDSAQSTGQQLTEDTFAAQQKAVPYPTDQLKGATQERVNLKERLLRQNNPNHVSYLYVLSYAQPLGYYVIKGKVSSTNSQMTTSTHVENHGDTGGGNLAYEAPGDDGSYGPNESGIFFFTTAGVMVQTDLNYVVADQPIAFGKLDVPKLG